MRSHWAHDCSTGGTLFTRSFSTRAFGDPFFRGSHSTAFTFLWHMHSPPFVGKIGLRPLAKQMLTLPSAELAAPEVVAAAAAAAAVVAPKAV